MSTPYWGQLPGPKVSAQAKGTRRLSDDSTATDHRQSLDGSGQPHARPNRSSIQTTNTEATTESSLSPYASPTRSSFQGQGLAPRPASLPYGQAQYVTDTTDRRHRRESRDHDHLPERPDYGTATPPAAPDVPRAPPVSFKPAHGNGGLSSAHTNSGGARLTKRRPDGNMEPAGQHEEDPVLARARATIEANSSKSRRSTDPDPLRNMALQGRPRGIRESLDGNREGTGEPDMAGHQRRSSAGIRSDRRRKFADDRSPLQRLELTLDSITKEEKRARVEAAEQRARERASQQESSRTGQQVRFRDRAPPSDQEDPSSSAIAAHRGPLTQNPPEEGRRYGSVSENSPKTEAPEKSPRTQVSEARMPVPVDSPKSDVPKRNLSFRERAAKNDVKLPTTADGESSQLPTTPATAPAGGGFSLTRSGSNKLKKEPPGDPWYSQRLEAEKRFASVQHQPEEAKDPAGRNPQRSNSWSVRTKPPAPLSARQPAGRNATLQGRDAAPTPLAGQDVQPFNQRTVPGNRDVIGPVGAERVQKSSAGVTNGKPQPPPPPPPRRASLGRPAAASTALGAGTGVGLSAGMAHNRRLAEREDSDDDREGHHHHYISNMMYHAKDNLRPGQGVYQPPKFLDEWKKGTVGTLSGSLLDLEEEPSAEADRDKAWWEDGSKRRNSMSSRPQKAEAFDGEYDETNAPTRFKPPLYLSCGPLLRYCGIRFEATSSRTGKVTNAQREIWRGSVMIVTRDQDSSYDIAPTLRLFLQPIDLLPPPPAEIRGGQSLPQEYVDPIAGHPKLGRKGETLYVRPVEHLEECVDVSQIETDDGLFEKTRSPPDYPVQDGGSDPHGSFAGRRKRIAVDGEKVGKYKDVRGFRLHAERGYTFWRFNVEVELRDNQQRIAYRINRGPSTGFWVPARGSSMNIMFHSCNGFSLGVETDEFSGPDPMWRDVLNTHQTRPFHVMLGGGDQIYNDAAMHQTTLFKQWVDEKISLRKHNTPFTAEMQDELELFYLERYCMWFSQGLFGLANSQIPMVNMYDDHDMIDGFGSYPHHDMNAPVMSGLGNVAFKYYVLFQHQSVFEETELTEPSWTLGAQPGPYINQLSRSLFLHLGSKVALLAVDARTERTRDEVVSEETWAKITDRLYNELENGGKVEHLLILLGVPIAYPRLVWLENILTSRLMDPVKFLGKAGMLGNLLNNFDGGVEVLDDLADHWTAKNHKKERAVVVEDLQDLAYDKCIRVTILSGDVHLAAVGEFYSNPKLGIAKHNDFRYMPNVISSAIVNTPPPDMLADVLNKRNKVHHFDEDTDEDMIPIFAHGVDGKPRNNKRLLPHRNWCSIREYVPGDSPPPSPGPEAWEDSPAVNPPRGGLLRRLSSKRRPSLSSPRPEKSRDRPPVSGGLFRTLSRRLSSDSERPSPGLLTRSMSWGRGDSKKGFFSRGKVKTPNDGGINGNWGSESEGEDVSPHEQPSKAVGLRGGGLDNEYEEGDDSYFTAKPPRRAATMPAETRTAMAGMLAGDGDSPPAPRPFHRTPTGLRKGHKNTEPVNLEGGLDICLNVEVSQKDPAGITVPYRLLVPRLFPGYPKFKYEAQDAEEHTDIARQPPQEDDGAEMSEEEYPADEETYVDGPTSTLPQRRPSQLKRLFSIGKGK